MKKNRYYYLSLLILLILSSATTKAEDNIPAFPGAEGHGRRPRPVYLGVSDDVVSIGRQTKRRHYIIKRLQDNASY